MGLLLFPVQPKTSTAEGHTAETPRPSTAQTDDGREGNGSGGSLIVHLPLNQSPVAGSGQAMIRQGILLWLPETYRDRAPVTDHGLAKAGRVEATAAPYAGSYQARARLIPALGQSCSLPDSPPQEDSDSPTWKTPHEPAPPRQKSPQDRQKNPHARRNANCPDLRRNLGH